MNDLAQQLAATRLVSRHLGSLSGEAKDHVLNSIACSIEESGVTLLEYNRKDLAEARSQSSKALTNATLARMTLTQEKIEQMARSVRAVATLADPVGKILLCSELDEGLELKRITCPFGVIAAVVEARPDAVIQLSALAFKSGNALMIKAGSEISRTASALLGIFKSNFEAAGIPADATVMVKTREDLHELLKRHREIDLVVPRGSSELVRFVVENTSIPVMGHADGVCHIYVDAAADQNLAVSVILDSKVQAPGTCNAVETVLVDRGIAGEFVPKLFKLLQFGAVKVRGCEIARELCGGKIEMVAHEEWSTEYGTLVLAIRVVDGVKDAIGHINRYGSHHTDCIVTEDECNAARFLREVDSAGVFHNVSTRLADGYRYGFGAEVGISTGKLHARGPVGLEGLVTYKYLLTGRGQCVSHYVGPRARRFKHELTAGEMRSDSATSL